MNRHQSTAEFTAAALNPATAGWREDPWRLHKQRYHDGESWTDAVTHYGPVPCLGCDQHRN